MIRLLMTIRRDLGVNEDSTTSEVVSGIISGMKTTHESETLRYCNMNCFETNHYILFNV